MTPTSSAPTFSWAVYTAFYFLWMAYPHFYFHFLPSYYSLFNSLQSEGIALLTKSPVTSILIKLMILSLCSSVSTTNRDLPLLWEAFLVA